MQENPRDQTRDRQKPLRVFVNSAERATIERLAKEAGLTLSAYVRAATLCQIIESDLHQKAVLDLLKAMGDLGRLGGLLKLWLAFNPGGRRNPRRGAQDVEGN
jgi:hypothetical protein